MKITHVSIWFSVILLGSVQKTIVDSDHGSCNGCELFGFLTPMRIGQLEVHDIVKGCHQQFNTTRRMHVLPRILLYAGGRFIEKKKSIRVGNQKRSCTTGLESARAQYL